MKSITIENIFTPDKMIIMLRFVLTLVFLFIIMKVVLKTINRITLKKLKPQTAMIINKVMKYTFFSIIGLYVLTALGIDLSALLGAAGIAGIAIGFAAQTSFSNIISGFFIITEHAIKIGDLVTVDTITGTVQSIDALSVKILTLDNQMVRVPNETIIKTNLINTTFHPIRRMRIEVGVDYSSDLKRVMEVLFAVAKAEKAVIADPAPSVIFDSFGESSIKVILAVWFKKEDFTVVKNAMMYDIHTKFNENNITISFPHVNVHYSESGDSEVKQMQKKATGTGSKYIEKIGKKQSLEANLLAMEEDADENVSEDESTK